jgi:hypothetical protein
MFAIWHFWSFLDNMNSSTSDNKMEDLQASFTFHRDKCFCNGEMHDKLMFRTRQDNWCTHAPGPNKMKYPPCNFIKCDIDVSFSTDHNWVEIGICLCGEFGMLMGAKTLWLQQILRSLRHFSINGEGLGISFWASSVLLRLKVVVSFNSADQDDMKLGSILTSCRALLLFICNNSY